jgi:ribosomal protein L2
LSSIQINSYFDLSGYVYTKDQAQFNYSISIQQPIKILETIEISQQALRNPDGSMKYIATYVAVVSYSIPTTRLSLIPYGTIIYSIEFSTQYNPTVYRSATKMTLEAAQSILNDYSNGINVYIGSAYEKSLQT